MVKYWALSNEGELRSGKCVSSPKILESGVLVLHESWQWMDGNQEHRKSIVEEIRDKKIYLIDDYDQATEYIRVTIYNYCPAED